MVRPRRPGFLPGIQGTLATLIVAVLVATAAAGALSGTRDDGWPPAAGAGSGSGSGSEAESTSGSDEERSDDMPERSTGPAENTVKGEVYLVTNESARTFTMQSMHGVTHYRINVVPDAPFELRSQREPWRVCAGGSNCVEMPDFDIAFFREHGGGAAVAGNRHYNVGPEEGFVPSNADFAHVYLRTAGATPDGFRGYAFVYLQGNPGTDVVPDWNG